MSKLEQLKQKYYERFKYELFESCIPFWIQYGKDENQIDFISLFAEFDIVKYGSGDVIHIHNNGNINDLKYSSSSIKGILSSKFLNKLMSVPTASYSLSFFLLKANNLNKLLSNFSTSTLSFSI